MLTALSIMTTVQGKRRRNLNRRAQPQPETFLAVFLCLLKTPIMIWSGGQLNKTPDFSGNKLGSPVAVTNLPTAIFGESLNRKQQETCYV